MEQETEITANYHTHTYRCKHASGDVIDYAKEAVEQGLTILGITEHTPLPDGRWNNVRMDMDQLDDYDSAIIKASMEYPQLKVLKGMECDWIPEYKNFYLEEFRDKRSYCYLSGSIHWFPSNDEWIFSYSPQAFGRGRDYADFLIDMIESEMFDYICHPDLFGLFSRKWNTEAKAMSRAICEAARTYKVPLEINGYGFRKAMVDTSEGSRFAYPYEHFWEIASDYGIEVVCNSDAHKPEDAAASIDLCRNIAEKYYLTFADLSHLDKCRTSIC